MSEEPKMRQIDYMWPFIGLALGTGLVAPLVLSTSIGIQAIAGLVFGGVPLGLLGLWYAARCARKDS